MSLSEASLLASPSPLPLFERATRSTIVMLIVRRRENGAWERSPKTFTPSELPNREAIRERFGGGKYEVLGRDAKRLVARTTFTLEGPALSIHPEFGTTERPGLPFRHGDRAYGSEMGARQALVFSLLDQGYSCIEVTQRTDIDNDTVRDIYLRWLTPDGSTRPTTTEEIQRLHALRVQHLHARLRSEWERGEP